MMKTTEMMKRTAACALVSAALLVGCGGDAITDPTDVRLGETTFVFVVNPTVNDANEESVPPPGPSQSGVSVSIQEGPSGTTGGDGVAVLGSLEAGTRAVDFDDGNGATGDLSLAILQGDLREVAVALDGTGAAEMVNVRYAFGGEVVEITPDMTVDDVNDALSQSNVIVLVRGGTYTGDIDFSGSNVTLFGEGAEGGNVTLDGNVTVSGSGNRLRGARVTGDLVVDGSDAGISFSSVAGTVTVDGSDTVLLNNAFCGSVSTGGSGTVALGNAGLAPLAAPSGGC